MQTVWTRNRAGTEARPIASPAPQFPQVHQLVLPTPWEAGPVQIYLIDAEPITLIDAGLHTKESREALVSGLESFGRGIDEIERIVLTHYHQDHVGQVQALRDSGVELELCAHEEDVDMVENFSVERDEQLEQTANLFREYGVPADTLEQMNAWRQERLRSQPSVCQATTVDRVLRGGDRVSFKDFELEVIHAPGHTAGHILLHHPESRVLFSGDHIMGGAAPNTENYYLDGLPDPNDPLRRRPRFKGLLQYRQSLRALRLNQFSCILPGYGGVIRATDRAIRDALLYYEVRIQRIERSLRSVTALGQAVTAYELWRALFPNDDPASQMRTKLLMVLGVLDVLEEEGSCATERRDDGVLVHSLRRDFL